MNEKRIKLLIEELRNQIKESDKMFLDGVNKSYIIDWLQGQTIKITMELSSILEKQKRLN